MHRCPPTIKVISVVAMSAVSAAAALGQSNPFYSRAPGYPGWSAFSDVKWKGEQPIVRVEDAWYELVSFHGVPTADIIAHCKKNGWQVKKRVAEDLVQVIRLMGHDIERTTDLVLRDAEGNLVTMKNVSMTEEKRSRIRPAAAPRRGPYAKPSLSRQEVLDDLKAFQTGLEAQFAYLKTNDVDYRAAIQAIADKAGAQMPTGHLAEELGKVMAMFIDGHAGVTASTTSFADGCLPFLIEPSGDQFVAVAADRSGFVDDEHPYLRAIDGVELAGWLHATEPYLAQGSPQYRRHRGLTLLSRSIQQFRGSLGLEASETLRLELASRDGRSRRRMKVKVSKRPISPGRWPPRNEPEVLAGNVGYLRITQMNDRAVELLQEWMPRFRDTGALVIDVRGNGGGIRTPILELAGYLLSPEDQPRIANVARYRLAPQFAEDHLSAARYLYRETSPLFDDHQRAEIRRFRASFTPEWNPPPAEFSDWHYMVLAKRADDTRFDYRRPVAILLDEGCFSATDIFLGAFKGWPRVTLVGQPSSGGSARSQTFQLPRSGLSIRCASMASFRPSGALYDTHGVEPDIVVVRPPDYYITGGTDVILQKALAVLSEQSGSGR